MFEASDDQAGVSRPVLMGIALKDTSSEGDEGVSEGERETFGVVMEMVKECKVW